MSEYLCTTCGEPGCLFTVPDEVDERIDLPTVCPWMSVETKKKPKCKKAHWEHGIL